MFVATVCHFIALALLIALAAYTIFVRVTRSNSGGSGSSGRGGGGRWGGRRGAGGVDEVDQTLRESKIFHVIQKVDDASRCPLWNGRNDFFVFE